MQITMFKGLLPVNLPDGWFADTKLVKFANVEGWQAIDFRQSGGKALKFNVDAQAQPVHQRWQEIEDPDSIEWTSKPFAIEGRSVVETFGQSGKVLDLTHL